MVNQVSGNRPYANIAAKTYSKVDGDRFLNEHPEFKTSSIFETDWGTEKYDINPDGTYTVSVIDNSNNKGQKAQPKDSTCSIGYSAPAPETGSRGGSGATTLEQIQNVIIGDGHMIPVYSKFLPWGSSPRPVPATWDEFWEQYKIIEAAKESYMDSTRDHGPSYSLGDVFMHNQAETELNSGNTTGVWKTLPYPPTAQPAQPDSPAPSAPIAQPRATGNGFAGGLGTSDPVAPPVPEAPPAPPPAPVVEHPDLGGARWVAVDGEFGGGHYELKNPNAVSWDG